MGIATLTPFGKCIKKRLVDIGRDQNWLISEVTKNTGLYFDRSYLYKIMVGKLTTPGVVIAICEILDIPMEKIPGTIHIKFDYDKADLKVAKEATEKVEQLIAKLKEAKSLADDLTSMMNVLRIKSDSEYENSLYMPVENGISLCGSCPVDEIKRPKKKNMLVIKTECGQPARDTAFFL